MYKITYKNIKVNCKQDETVLNAFLRQMVDLPFSCREGVCQVCMLRVVEGDVPLTSIHGLTSNLVETGHFLPCQCKPTSDMKLASPLSDQLFIKGIIEKIEPQNKLVCRVKIKLPEHVIYKTGQFINVKVSDCDFPVKSYSISSAYSQSKYIWIDVQIMKNGQFSGWLFNSAKPGDSLDIQMPLGDCFHTVGTPINNKLIVASGSGLGAALAIANEALEVGNNKAVKLCHYSRNEDGRYRQTELEALSINHKNFSFQQIEGDDLTPVNDWLFCDFNLNSELYIFGSRRLINEVRLKAENMGMSKKDLHFDHFDFKSNPGFQNSLNRINDMEFVEELPRKNTEDSNMWNILNDGNLLRNILETFYTVVFDDPLLKPFFKGVTKDHVIGKQYSFLNQYYEGGDCYFGDRPRNAHHWMVISNELFDHRERLFKDSCVKWGLKEPYLSQLLALHESYRKFIVKSRVWPRITGGVIEPLKSFENLKLDIAGLCDGCGQEIASKTVVQFHGQTGEMYCPECSHS